MVLHPANARTKMAYRQKYCNPYIAQLIKQWVMLCEQCIEESRIDNRLSRPPWQNPIEHITGPEVPFQIDLVTELLPSNDYQNIVTFVSFNFHADFGFLLLFPWFYWLLVSPVISFSILGKICCQQVIKTFLVAPRFIGSLGTRIKIILSRIAKM